MRIPFTKGNILLPKHTDMTKWSVVACDQYTSEKKYWEEVKKTVGDFPSTLNLILPEIYLGEDDVNKRIEDINNNMQKLVDRDFFKEYKDSMIYIERKLANGKVREGLIGVIDLEDYSYEQGSKALIRSTEKTVVERLPQRIKIRENALLEFPHIMLLIDDDKKEIIENLKNEVKEQNKVYDFNLMQNGGHIKGYKLSDNTIKTIESKLEGIMNSKKDNIKNKETFLFAVGDGNHSLVIAKDYYENLKKKLPEKKYLNHPSRYALVELVNLHSNALEFEAIHRIVFNTDVDDLLNNLKKYYNINKEGKGQEVEIITKDIDEKWYIENPKSNISVGSIQIFLDEYLKNHHGKIDYIHGEDVVKNFAKKNNNIGFIFKPIKKEDLFKTIILEKILPKKTFSIGYSYDKRYYLEGRRIK